MKVKNAQARKCSTKELFLDYCLKNDYKLFISVQAITIIWSIFLKYCTNKENC